MPHAEILVEDEGEAVAIRFNFGDAFDPDSRAHQIVNIIRKHLDETLVVLEERTDEPRVKGLVELAVGNN